MRLPRVRTALLCAAVGSFALIPAAGSATSWKSSTLTLKHGGTTVAVDAGAAAALQSLGISLAPTGAAGAGPEGVTFPITKGKLDKTSLAGQIRHVGGLNLTKGMTTVGLKRFFINIDAAPDLTGKVSVNGSKVGRVELFSLDLSGLQVENKGRYLRLSGVGLKLTQGAADALNGAFDTTAFTKDLLFGTAVVEARVSSKGWGDKYHGRDDDKYDDRDDDKYDDRDDNKHDD
jgi:hypothetical protein